VRRKILKIKHAGLPWPGHSGFANLNDRRPIKESAAISKKISASGLTTLWESIQYAAQACSRNGTPGVARMPAAGDDDDESSGE
jgi:hypothetical protein